MSFLYPVFLVGALAVAIPIVLHLLRRDVAPDVPFSAVRLLRRSPIERTRRRRLRDLILLAARVLAVLLLASAFARPYLRAADAPALRIVALDRSFSMSAPGRFARALDLARGAVRDAAFSQRVGVIAFDERADVLAEPGTVADARAALDRVAAGFGATRYRTAIERALELSSGGPAHLVVVTDLGRSGWEDDQPITIPANWSVDIRDAGEAPGNVAVTAVHREADRVVAVVRNWGNTAFAGEIRVNVDGKRAGATRATVDAGGSADVSVDVRLPKSGVLSVAIDDATGFAADNVRYAALDAAGGRRVLVVTAGGPGRPAGFFLSRALDTSEGSDEGLSATTIPGSALAGIAAPELRGYAAAALLSTRGLERRGRDALGAYVQGGGGLFVAAGPDVDGALLSDALGWQPQLAPMELAERPLTLGATDLRHPVFRPFGSLAANLGQARFDRVWRVRADGWDVAARFADGTPALLERTHGAGRVLLFTSDLDRRWNDFPLQPTFVPFALEAIRYVSGGLAAPAAYTPATAPRGAGPQPGVFRLANGQIVTINVDPRESTTTRMTPGEFREMMKSGTVTQAASGPVRASETEAAQGYWRYGLLLMLAALVAESILGARS